MNNTFLFSRRGRGSILSSVHPKKTNSEQTNSRPISYLSMKLKEIEALAQFERSLMEPKTGTTAGKSRMTVPLCLRNEGQSVCCLTMEAKGSTESHSASITDNNPGRCAEKEGSPSLTPSGWTAAEPTSAQHCLSFKSMSEWLQAGNIL